MFNVLILVVLCSFVVKKLCYYLPEEASMNTQTKFRLVYPSIILFLFSMSFSQTRRPTQRPAPAPFLQHAKSYEETQYLTRVVLKNGMTVLVNEYRAQPVVSVQAFVQAGFLDEPPQRPGLATLLGAMIRRGSSDKAAGTLIQNVHALGGVWDHSTDCNTSRFEIVAPAPQWKRALNIQADALLNPSLEQEALKLESKLMLDQARGAMDDPMEFAEEKLLELSFNQARMGKWIYIVNSGLRDATRESLSRFHKAMYSPSRMLLVISGDVNSGEVLNEVARIYDKPWPEIKASVPLSVSNSQNDFRYMGMRGDIAVPALFFGFHTPGSNSQDYAAMEVLQAILGIGEGSILSTRLKNQKKVILNQKIKFTDSLDSSFLEIQLQVEPNNIDSSEIALLTEMELLKRQEPDEAEMERAFAQLELRRWVGIESVTERGRAYAHYELLGDWKKLNGYISGLRKVKPSDIRRVANKYLNLENCSILEYMPRSVEERKLTSESVKRTLQDLAKPSADQELAEREKETVLALNIPETAGGFKFSEVQSPFQTASILRGPDMFIREDHTAPVVDMGIFLAGGRLSETKENAGITMLMTRLMARGPKGGSANQFNRQLEIYGGRIQPIVADDYFGFYFTILSRNIDEGLSMILEAIRNPGFDKDSIGQLINSQSSAIPCRTNSKDCSFQLMRAALFGDFPYSLDVNGTEASLSAINSDSLQSWYNSHVRNRKVLVVAVGDTKGTSLASYFVKQFSGSRIQAAELPAEFSKPLNSRQTIERKWIRGTSQIIVGFQAPPVEDEDRYGLLVLQSYAGEQGNLSQQIRDQRGAAFQMKLIYKPRLRGGSLVACADANPDNEQAALDIIMEQMSRIAAGPIIYRDYRAAINGAVGAYWIQCQNRLSQIEDVAIYILAGRGIGEYQDIPKYLQGFGQDDFEEIARKILKMDKAVILRLHGKSSLN
jgi:zinc protease